MLHQTKNLPDIHLEKEYERTFIEHSQLNKQTAN